MPVAVSTLALALIAAGVVLRRRRWLHWRLMLTALVFDLGLVLYLAISRDAVARAATDPHPVVWVHPAISAMVLVCWLGMLRLGWLMLHGRPAARHPHRLLAMVFVTLRVANHVPALALPPAVPAVVTVKR